MLCVISFKTGHSRCMMGAFKAALYPLAARLLCITSFLLFYNEALELRPPRLKTTVIVSNWGGLTLETHKD